METLEVVLIEDNLSDAILIRELLSPEQQLGMRREPQYHIKHYTHFEEAARNIVQARPDVVLLDLTLPDTPLAGSFPLFRERFPLLPVVVLTGLADEQFGVATIHQGAEDYLPKGEVTPSLLRRAIRYAIERQKIETEVELYREHLEELVMARTEALEASQEKLRQSERMASLGTLAAGIAHEINNPVGAILITAENAIEAMKDMSSGSECSKLLGETCEKIILQARRCSLVVKGVLQFAREQVTERAPTQLNMIVEHAIELVRDSAGSNSIQIAFERDETLQPIIINPLEIEQVLVNLIQNAVQACEPNGVVQVTTSHNRDGGVSLAVSDNGRGLTEEERKRIFDPFYTSRADEGGTGLGLSIVHSIVKGYGGTIDVSSEVGVGTKIVVVLPDGGLRERANHHDGRQGVTQYGEYSRS